tara:strand:- start:174 stop:359 length:186 start_codon:yes stop_codon:yes gene_type:complete
MTELTELERLQKNVVDTAAADAADAAYDADWASRTDYDDTAWAAYRKALQELEDYLKEQDE